MAQRRHHYEAAFEHLLRSRRIPYIAVDEAKKSLVPSQVDQPRWTLDAADSIKSFDFVVYGRGTNVLAEVKGRRLSRGLRQECWVTQDDVDSLLHWQNLFGPEFEAVFVFLYACDDQPADALFADMFEHGGVWYTVKCVTVGEYQRKMKLRSPKWRTVDLAQQDFRRVARPLFGPKSAALDLGPEVPLMEIA